jgi:hypothetical protein
MLETGELKRLTFEDAAEQLDAAGRTARRRTTPSSPGSCRR